MLVALGAVPVCAPTCTNYTFVRYRYSLTDRAPGRDTEVADLDAGRATLLATHAPTAKLTPASGLTPIWSARQQNGLLPPSQSVQEELAQLGALVTYELQRLPN